MLSQNNMPMGMVTSAISSDIATTVSGDTFVVWNQYNVSEFDIFFSWFRPGSGWSTPIKINSRPGNAFVPRIKTDANGNAMVIWSTDQYDMGIRQFKADSGWQSEYFLPHYCQGFDLAVLPGGGFLLLMQEANEHGILVTSRKYELATGWTAPLVLQNDTGVYGVDVQVAIGGNGDGFAVWAQYDRNIGEAGAITYIWASQYSATGWEPAHRIGNLSVGSGIQPKVSIDGSGNATAVWTQYDGNPGLPATTRSNIMSNQYSAGTGWGTDRLVSIGNSGNAYEPTVATNAEGNTIVVWRQSTLWRNGTVNLWYTTFSREKDWSQPGKVSDEIYWSGDEGYQGRITSTPVLNMDGSGDAVVL